VGLHVVDRGQEGDWVVLIAEHRVDQASHALSS
jgi:hypothetical protein